MSVIYAFVIYGLAWSSFGLGHSLLASARAKDLLAAKFRQFYRLSYNAFAVVHILTVWLIGDFVFAATTPFTLAPVIEAALDSLSLLGVIILILALKSYDLGLLAGTAQIRNHRRGLNEAPEEALNTSGFHAYVRHPVYSGAYLILWGGAQDDFSLATAIFGSAYLLIGTWFEERRLVALYGAPYAQYKSAVPAFFPWRGKAV